MEVNRPDEPSPPAVDTASPAYISDLLEVLRKSQEQFDRHVAAALTVDAAGLATMEHLVRNGPVTPTEIARKLGISTAATTLVIDRLEGVGHVHRGPHPSDRRKVIVTAQDRSVRAAMELVSPMLDGVDQVMASMTQDERVIVSSFVTRVTAVYESAMRASG